MVATVSNQNGTYYVDNKPENVPAGNLGGAGTHTQCKDEQAAKEMADAINAGAIQTATPNDNQAKTLDTKG